MATATPTRSTPTGGDPCVTMRGLDGRGYLTRLRLPAERPRPRIIYLDGEAWLVTMSYLHEHLVKRLGQFIIEVLVDLGILCVPAGSTTLKRRKKRGGVEGDETFSIASGGRIRGRTKTDLRLPHDPPPDLAVEVVHTHAAAAAIEVYRRLGVAEVGVWEDESLRILLLQTNGKYAESPTSQAFPFLAAAEVADWIARPQTGSETVWLRELRRWVETTRLPRFRQPGA